MIQKNLPKTFLQSLSSSFISTKTHDDNRINPLRIALIYALLGTIWIIVSDRVVGWLFADKVTVLIAQTIKGLSYIGMTTVLVYWLARRSLSDIKSKMLQDQLQRSEEVISATLASIGEAVILVDSVTRTIVECNPATERIFGFTKEELIGQSTEMLHINHRTYEHFATIGDPILSETGLFQTEFRMKRKDGTIIDTQNTVSTVHKHFGWKAGVVSVIRDITAHKQLEAALREKEEYYRLLAENTRDVIWTLNMNHKFTYVNPAIEQLTGYTPQDFIGTQLSKHTTESTFKKLSEVIEHEISRGPDHPGIILETEMLRKDGSSVPVEVNGTIVFDQSGTPVSIQGTARDITERKRAEDLLRATEADLKDAYAAQTAVNTILKTSLENIPLDTFLQKALSIILSVPWIAFEPIGNIQLAEDDQPMLVMKAQINLPEAVKKASVRVPFGQCLCGKAALTQQIQFTDHNECFDICHGGMLSYGHYAVPIVISGRTLGVLNIFLKEGYVRNQKEDKFLLAIADALSGIIVRRQVENEKEKLNAQLLQAQKMEAVGQLAGGISHDFNNILTAIIGYAYMLKMKLNDDEKLRTFVDHILSLSDRAANLTQSLLAFSRKQIMHSRPVNLNQNIRNVEKMLVRIIGEDIQLQTMLSEQELIVIADPGQIEQVLMNLATNARDAMPEGGHLSITSEIVTIDNVSIEEYFIKEGAYALIEITDTGAGMDKETREKIFDPFFTTKEVGKGTGLGLSMVYGIIKQHNGYITVYSEPGEGTTFRIYLPLIEANAETEKVTHEVSHDLETGTETILLAEDENEVRAFTKKLLEEYGYKVIEAVDGDDAIHKFKLHKNKIQLVLLDVIMPNRSGREVYEAIKKITPDIKVLFTSGYPADHISGIIAKGTELISKPASPTKLLKKIREILDK